MIALCSNSSNSVAVSHCTFSSSSLFELPQPTNVGWGFLRAFARYPLVQLMGVPTENKPVFRNVFVCWRKSDIPVHPAPCPLIQLTSTK